MRISLLSLALLLLWPQDEYTLLKKVQQQADFFTTDQLENSFLVKQYQLFKYQPDGTLQCTFSNLTYGNISFVDALNPHKILVFYKDFSRIVFLDNTLTENWRAIDLQEMGLEQASAVCSSYDNGLWIFDQVNFELFRYDQDLQMTQDVKNVQQLTREVIQANFMMESGDWLFINDPEKGIFVFDLFGTFFKKIPITGLNNFQVFGETIYYFKDGQLKSYDIKKLEDKTVSLPVKDCRMVRMEKDRLMVLKDKEFWIYRVK